MGCFCAVPEEFYCEVLLLDESKLTLTTQQQGIKVGAGARPRGLQPRGLGAHGFVFGLSPPEAEDCVCTCWGAESGRTGGGELTDSFVKRV